MVLRLKQWLAVLFYAIFKMGGDHAAQPRTQISLLMVPVGSAIDPQIDADKVVEVINAHTEAIRAENERLVRIEEAAREVDDASGLKGSQAKLTSALRALHSALRSGADEGDREGPCCRPPREEKP